LSPVFFIKLQHNSNKFHIFARLFGKSVETDALVDAQNAENQDPGQRFPGKF
jgi:hypothetical protein